MTPTTKPDTGMAHTAGPFDYRSDRTIAANGVPLARCYAGRNEAANGALFAASSELLDACNTAFDFLGGIDGASATRDTLLGAILKATGAA